MRQDLHRHHPSHPVVVPKPHRATLEDEVFEDPSTQDTYTDSKYLHRVQRAKRYTEGPMPVDLFLKDGKRCPPEAKEGPAQREAYIALAQRLRGSCKSKERITDNDLVRYSID